MAISAARTTRFGLSGYMVLLYGSFVGKRQTAPIVVDVFGTGGGSFLVGGSGGKVGVSASGGRTVVGGRGGATVVGGRRS